jgi:hypothetical protein
LMPDSIAVMPLSWYSTECWLASQGNWICSGTYLPDRGVYAGRCAQLADTCDVLSL